MYFHSESLGFLSWEVVRLWMGSVPLSNSPDLSHRTQPQPLFAALDRHVTRKQHDGEDFIFFLKLIRLNSFTRAPRPRTRVGSHWLNLMVTVFVMQFIFERWINVWKFQKRILKTWFPIRYFDDFRLGFMSFRCSFHLPPTAKNIQKKILNTNNHCWSLNWNFFRKKREENVPVLPKT